jgi:uncharacterized protein YjbI with pentapeptide repeats
MMNTTDRGRNTRCYNINKAISSILVPIMIGLLTIAVTVVQLYIANQQREQDLFLANQTRMKDLEIAEQNHQQALFLASEQQKDTILNDYLDFLAEFLENNKDQLYNTSQTTLPVQFKTFAVLDQLDGKRKAHIVRALYNTGLISRKPFDTKPEAGDMLSVSLSYANLTHVELGTSSLEFLRRSLNNAFFVQCVLTNASFRHLCISGVSFDFAQLEYADFTTTAANYEDCFDSKQHITFQGARLVGARFYEAKFRYGTFTQALFDGALLQHFQCYDCSFREAMARRVDFSSSIISGNGRVS